MPAASRSEILSTSENAMTALDRYGVRVSDGYIAAINQVRYVGHHVLNASVRDAVKESDELFRAKSHADRALNDARDGAILSILIEIRDFLAQQYSETELKAALCGKDVSTVCKELLDVRTTLENAGMAKSIKEGDVVDTCLLNARQLLNELHAAVSLINDGRRRTAAVRLEDEAKHRLELQRELADRRRYERRKHRRQSLVAIFLAIFVTIYACVQLGKELGVRSDAVGSMPRKALLEDGFNGCLVQED